MLRVSGHFRGMIEFVLQLSLIPRRFAARVKFLHDGPGLRFRQCEAMAERQSDGKSRVVPVIP
jgi:hypothetical protein